MGGGWLRDTRYISQLAGVGVFVAFAVAVLIVFEAGSRILSEGPQAPWGRQAEGSSAIGDSANLSSESIKDQLFNYGNAFSIFVFSYTYGFILPTLRKSMVNPEELHSAVSKSTGLMTLMYSVVVCVSYLAWGAFVEGSVVDSMTWCSVDAGGNIPASIKSPGSWAC